MDQNRMKMLILCVGFALSFYIHGAKADVSFSLRDTSNGAYKTFIKALRQQLTVNTNKVYGIPVLKFQTKTDNERFLLINLTNSDNSLITLAMDVFNASIVAYRTNGLSFFFQDAPELARRVLFAETNRSTLTYSSSYDSLEKASVSSRFDIPLGPRQLNDAITNLFKNNANSSPASFIVIIQMISDAAKFKFIEQNVHNNIIHNQTFTSSQTMMSLEDNWSELSKQIQMSLTLGLFSIDTIDVPSNDSEIYTVDNIGSPIISGIALLHNRCSANKSCEVMKNRTTNIIGRDGLCVNIKDGQKNDKNPIVLWPCGDQEKTNWTFIDDGTIRSLGKCMTTSGYSAGNYVMINNCDTAEKPATQWILSPNGTITNPKSGLVVTAQSGAEGTNLTLDSNTGETRQGWRAGNTVLPNSFITTIVGLNDMCLEAIENNSRVDLAKCESKKINQFWALYGDGTVRVVNDKNMCITATDNTKSSLIGIKKCDGSSKQRWVFNTDGSIFNPNSNMVMDVRESNANLHQIILYPFENNANQEWVLMF